MISRIDLSKRTKEKVDIIHNGEAFIFFCGKADLKAGGASQKCLYQFLLHLSLLDNKVRRVVRASKKILINTHAFHQMLMEINALAKRCFEVAEGECNARFGIRCTRCASKNKSCLRFRTGLFIQIRIWWAHRAIATALYSLRSNGLWYAFRAYEERQQDTRCYIQTCPPWSSVEIQEQTCCQIDFENHKLAAWKSLVETVIKDKENTLVNDNNSSPQTKALKDFYESFLDL